MSIDELLNKYRSTYPPQPYVRPSTGSDWPDVELVQVTAEQGLVQLNETAPANPQPGQPRRNHGDNGENCHIWVVDVSGIPCILETAGGRSDDERLRHTNLTGGEAASIGGELWFQDRKTVYLSGASRRYPPRSEEQLNRAVELFQQVGFEVTSLGWDNDLQQPLRVLV